MYIGRVHPWVGLDRVGLGWVELGWVKNFGPMHSSTLSKMYISCLL